MNTELLMSLIPASAVSCLVIGFYKTLLEQKVQSQERAKQLLGNASNTTNPAGLLKKDQDNILKKRKKNKTGKESRLDKLEIQLEQANLLVTVPEFLLISLGASVTIGLLGWVFSQGDLLSTVLATVCGLVLPYVTITLKVLLRMKKAASQFADVLDSMVNAFKTGFSFSRTIQMVSDNHEDPWGTEFGKMAAEMNLGSSMEAALYNLAKRVPSTDVDLFVAALLIQKDTGGNMAELLATLSKTIRDRYKLFQRVSAISAQGKLSAGIVCCIPFLLCGIMFLFLPEPMIAFFTNPIGILLASLAGFWMLCGIGVLYNIVQIEV
jgi:tight adherence protein B